MLPALHTLLLHKTVSGDYPLVNLIFTLQLGLFCLVFGDVMKSSTQKKMAPGINWSSKLLSNYSAAHASELQ